MAKVASLSHKYRAGDARWYSPLLVGAMWALLFLPLSEPLGVLLLGVFVLLPAVSVELTLLALILSFLAQETFALNSETIYWVRAYWIVCLLYWGALKNAPLNRSLLAWQFAGGALIALGVAVTWIRRGDPPTHSYGIEAAASVLWVMCGPCGYWYARLVGNSVLRRHLGVVTAVIACAVFVGVAQWLWGLSPYTAPAEVIRATEPYADYASGARVPFLYFSSNTITVVLLGLFPLLFLVMTSPVVRAALTLLVLSVAALAKTRSYIALLFVELLVLAAVLRPRATAVLAPLLIGIVVSLVVLVSLAVRADIDLASVIRLEHLGETRFTIWRHTLEEIDGMGMVVGTGWGSGEWAAMFHAVALQKEVKSPHSAPLQFLGQSGLVGTVYWAALVSWIGFSWGKAFVQEQKLATGAWLGLLAVCIRELVAESYILHHHFLSGYFWLLLGAALAVSGPRSTTGGKLG